MNTRSNTTAPVVPASEAEHWFIQPMQSWPEESRRTVLAGTPFANRLVATFDTAEDADAAVRDHNDRIHRDKDLARRLASAERMVKLTLCDADRIEQSVLNFIVREDIAQLQEASRLRGKRLRAVLTKASAFDHMDDEQRRDPIAIDLAMSIADDLRDARSPVLRENPFPIIAGRAEREIAEAYCEWLHQEHIRISLQLYPTTGGAYGLTPCNTLASSFHFPHGGRWQDVAPPSERAVAVLELVGVDLSDAGRIPSGEEYDAAQEAGR